MRKIIYKKDFLIITLLLATVLGFMFSSTTTVHAMSKSAQHRMYKTTMKNYVKKAKSS